MDKVLSVIYKGMYRRKTMEKLAQEYDTKADLIDELRTLLDTNEDNKYCYEFPYYWRRTTCT